MSDGGAGVQGTALRVVLLGVVGCPFVAAQEAVVSVDEVDPAVTCDSRRNNWKCLHPDFVVGSSVTDSMGDVFFTCPSGCEATGQECCDPGCCANMDGPTCVPFNVNTINVVVVGDGTLAHDHHVTLPVGSTVMVACHPGYIIPPDKTFTNDEVPLSCTPEGAPYAHTEIVCVHDHRGSGSSGHAFGHSQPAVVVGTGAGLAHNTISTDRNRAKPSAPDLEESSHHAVGITVAMLVMIGAVVATVVGKRKHQTSGGGALDRRRIDDGHWRSSTGSIGLRVAIGGSAAEISLNSSLLSEQHGMGNYDADAEAHSDAPVVAVPTVEASLYAPGDSSDQDSLSGTEVYTSGEEGTELEFQVMVPEILDGSSYSAFTMTASR
eukprot:COSAG02_NODE_788_length_17190_cov_18.177403_1_plen_378_part_00